MWRGSKSGAAGSVRVAALPAVVHACSQLRNSIENKVDAGTNHGLNCPESSTMSPMVPLVFHPLGQPCCFWTSAAAALRLLVHGSTACLTVRLCLRCIPSSTAYPGEGRTRCGACPPYMATSTPPWGDRMANELKPLFHVCLACPTRAALLWKTRQLLHARSR